MNYYYIIHQILTEVLIFHTRDRKHSTIKHFFPSSYDTGHSGELVSAEWCYKTVPQV